MSSAREQTLVSPQVGGHSRKHGPGDVTSESRTVPAARLRVMRRRESPTLCGDSDPMTPSSGNRDLPVVSVGLTRVAG